MVAGLFAVMSVWCFSSARAAVIHLDVDFSDYTLGNVAGQSGKVSGKWGVPASWVGTVVAATGYDAGTKSLEVYRVGRARGYVGLATPLNLASADKIYMSLDLYLKDSTSNLDVMLSSGSPGRIPNLGFGLQVNGTGIAAKFISDTTGGILRVASGFKPAKNTWYRFEWEITPTAIGVGTYSVFVSDQKSGTRSALLTDQPYSFSNSSLSTLYLVPISKAGTPSNAAAINNIFIQSGLKDFPENPMDKSGQ